MRFAFLEVQTLLKTTKLELIKMKYAFVLLGIALVFAVSANAQTMTSTAKSTSPSPNSTGSSSKMESAKKRGPVFRANKGQIKGVQAMLKTKGVYSGEATGSLDDATRTSIKNFQKDNGLKQTGTLNRATLEKMGIALTDPQKAIPASPGSYVDSGSKPSSGAAKSRGPIFRATKGQIMDAQKMLNTGGMYSGDATGKLDEPTRAGLKKYQDANGLKVTGTLNQVTLEKMGIALTDKQKETSAGRK